MHIAFKRLFRIRIGHDWYPDGAVRDGEIAIVPTPSTAVLLDELGLRTRAHADGLTVYVEIEPGSGPPVLRRPLGATSYRLAFELRWANTPLLNITELPPFRPGRTIFSFDNLRADAAPGRLHLGDRIADARVGPPVMLVTGPAYAYALGAPAVNARITTRSRFGRTVATIDAHSPDPEIPLVEYRLDLGGLLPGRYEITDDQGGRAAIYYDTGLAASRPFGIIEIYTRTEELTPDGSNHVPAAYRVLADGTLTGIDPYHVQFQAVATTWRYIVTKKYSNNSIALEALAIDGPVVFTRAVTPPRAVFTSTGAVRLVATRRGHTLIEQPGNKELRDLPDPDLTTPLGSASAGGALVSDIFVYV